MRTLHEAPRGCGYRKAGGCYLMGETGTLGALAACIEIDPPIPVDCDIIPFNRGVYAVNFDAVLTEDDQKLWLTGSSKKSLGERDHRSWEIEQYGMTLHERSNIGICAGFTPEQVEYRLMELAPFKNVYLSDYILDIGRYGKGRRVAREVAKMQEFRLAKNWKGLLASAWRLVGYDGQGSDRVYDALKRVMVSIGALEDAVLF